MSAEQTTASPDASRILIVDDDASVRNVLTALLTAEGYGVSAAPSAVEALSVSGHERDPPRHQRHEDARARRVLAAGSDAPGASADRGADAHRLRRHRGRGRMPAAWRRRLPPQAAQDHRSGAGHRAGPGPPAHRDGAPRVPDPAPEERPREDQRAAGRLAGGGEQLPEHPDGPGGGARCPRARDLRPLPARRALHLSHRQGPRLSRTRAGRDRSAARRSTTSARSASRMPSSSSPVR